MVGKIKDYLFFPVASYFAFWANIQLKKWNPRVIVITGSSGKTTLFNMAESQIGDIAHYSHHANSAIGVPFDILDIHRETLKTNEWLSIFLKAPIQAFKKPYTQKLYIVECDADRPGEGKFLANLLNPEVTLWISTSRTHSMNYDKLVGTKFKNVDEAIAYEYGYFFEKTSALLVIDGESKLMKDQIKRAHCDIKQIYINELENYELSRDGTAFRIKEIGAVRFRALLPKEIFYSIRMVQVLCNFLTVSFDPKFSKLKLPPARSSVFRGIKNITIIDSTYNANLSSMSAILSMFNLYPAKTKWGVFGDMLEQGRQEKEEHEKLADLILGLNLERIVLLGPRIKKYTLPKLAKSLPKEVSIDSFENPKDVLEYLKRNIMGNETILFKGARFLEGVIEGLLLDKREKILLARRERVWEERRKKWGL